MLRLPESLGGLAAHALGGRVGGDQLGVRGLQLPQLDRQRVEGGVGDLGRVEHVVEVLVAADLLPQFFDPVRGDGCAIRVFAHGWDYRRQESRMQLTFHSRL